jgi:hypothetical protein
MSYCDEVHSYIYRELLVLILWMILNWLTLDLSVASYT